MATVLIYGSGGRDHCLADRYADSQHVDKVYFVPGNPGILCTPKGKRKLIEQVHLSNPDDFEEVAKFCNEKKVDLVDIGSENPLSAGIVNVLNGHDIPTVGAKFEYAKIENDRAFTDFFLKSINAPKPEYRVFYNPDKAKSYVCNIGYQVVVKANGLAAGKGAVVCDDEIDALNAIDEIMIKKKFGTSGNSIVIEERKYGTEISFFAYLDGTNVLPLKMFCQDYKQAFDPNDFESIKKFGGNPNTGGMGGYCPHKLVKAPLVNKIIKTIVNPTVNVIYNDFGWNYKGVLYFGLNLDLQDELSVFEINVRHGDPEFQVMARKLSTDFFELGMSVWEGKLDQVKQVWNDRYYIDVIGLEGRSKASRGWNPGYPKRYGKGHKIKGLDKLDRGVALYFASVDIHPEKGLVTDGGRVLHLVVGGKTKEDAIKQVYDNIKKIEFFDSKQNSNCIRYRNTIGT